MEQSLRVIYCLTSSGGDIFEAMTRVSLATVRQTNPSIRIEIACDQYTLDSLEANKSLLFDECDAVQGFHAPEGDPIFRNRYIKTQLRCLLTGPFLYLDSDTVVRKSLSSLLEIKADIAAAPNHSADTIAEQIWREDQDNLDAMGWQVKAPYVNSGVIWQNDTLGARRLAEAWHHNWLCNVRTTGRLRDQTALNYSLWVTPDVQLETLDHGWNAQIGINPEPAKGAVIWHLYSSSNLCSRHHFTFCCERIETDCFLHPDSDLVRSLITDYSVDISTEATAALIETYFDTEYYLGTNPDVAAAGINPLKHYITHGWREGRWPTPWFDPNEYRRRLPGVVDAQTDPFAHYIATGDPEDAQSTYEDFAMSKANCTLLRSEGGKSCHTAGPGINTEKHPRKPSKEDVESIAAFFDAEFYRSNHPEIDRIMVDPLTHFLMVGWRQGLDPSPTFSVIRYWHDNEDVRKAQIHPFVHYCRIGRLEIGRRTMERTEAPALDDRSPGN